MKVEDTAFGPLVGTPKKVQDETDAAAAEVPRQAQRAPG